MTTNGVIRWKTCWAALLGGVIGLGCGNSNAPDKISKEPSSPATSEKLEISGVLGAAKTTTSRGNMSLKQALSFRRSVRSFAPRDLTKDEMSELLWAGQGVTHKKGLRTAPSAGATYPLEIHVVTPNGVYQYAPASNVVKKLSTRDRMSDLATAALRQASVKTAAANFVIGGVLSRTAQRYGDRAERYVILEAGCASENLMLMATSLGLGSVMIGAYDDERVKEIAMLPENSIPYAIISVGALNQSL